MEYFVPLSVVFLSALAYASLGLNLGAMLLLYHSSRGRFLYRQSFSLVSSYIFGIIFMLFLALSATIFLIFFTFGSTISTPVLLVIAGLIGVLSMLIFAFYYRKGGTTELWLPRSISRYISSRARATSSRVESFSLGMLVVLAEFPISILLCIVSADAILALPPSVAIYSVLLLIFIAVLPLLIVRLFFRKGKNIADIQHWREKSLIFLRFLTAFLFLALSAFIIAFKIGTAL